MIKMRHIDRCDEKDKTIIRTLNKAIDGRKAGVHEHTAMAVLCTHLLQRWEQSPDFMILLLLS